jgi:hypothetical protein
VLAVTLSLITDTTPAADKDGYNSKDEFKFCFRLRIGSAIFTTAWMGGNEEYMEQKQEEVQQAFEHAEGIEVVG